MSVTRAIKSVGFRLSLVIAFLFLTPTAYANTITVNANCTLAQAITTANDGTSQGSCASGADNAADTIIFQASISEVVPTADLPEITETLTIDGGANGVIINGKQGSEYRKLLKITQKHVNLTVNNVTFKNAGYKCQGLPNSCAKFNAGGAIEVDSKDSSQGPDLTITNTTFDTGGTYESGHGSFISMVVYGGGNLTIRNSVFRNGGNDGTAGAIFWNTAANTTLTIEDSLFENNHSDSGGAIKISERGAPVTAVIRRSVFRNNTANTNNPYVYPNGVGGAISTVDSTRLHLTIENSTFYGNEAKNLGGALYLRQGSNQGSVTLKHVTIVGNTAPANKGGGVMAARSGLVDAVKLHLYNSLLANNGAGKDCQGTAVTESLGSLSQDGSCANSTVTGDPLLGAVTGTGSRAHYPLRAGSPALDIGSPTHCLSTDQIGTSRPQAGKCDAGAIERPFTPPAEEEESGSGKSSTDDAAAAAPAVQGPPPAVLLNQMGYRITATHGLYSGIQCKQVGPEGVGINWVLERGFIDAIDCWGYVEQGVEVCFPALGAVVFLDASTSPRSASMQYGAYIAADNYTCVSINRPGTIVLVEQGEKPAPEPAPADIPPVTETALQNCMVTTLYALNFRDTPDGKKIGGVGYMWTLTALAKSGDWYKVDNNGVVGWISAKYVSTHGVCG